MSEEYRQVIEFLKNQSKDSKEKKHEIIQEVLEEKKFLIYQVLQDIHSIFISHQETKPGEFSQTFNDVYNNFNLNEIKPVGMFSIENIFHCLKEMLKPDYVTPMELDAHLVGLLLFYEALTPKDARLIDPSVFIRLDISLMKIIRKVAMITEMLFERGNYQDKIFSRNRKISEAKHDKEDIRHIPWAYAQIEVTDKSKNQIAKEIRGLILSKWQTAPSTDTIKRYLGWKK